VLRILDLNLLVYAQVFKTLHIGPSNLGHRVNAEALENKDGLAL